MVALLFYFFIFAAVIYNFSTWSSCQLVFGFIYIARPSVAFWGFSSPDVWRWVNSWESIWHSRWVQGVMLFVPNLVYFPLHTCSALSVPWVLLLLDGCPCLSPNTTSCLIRWERGSSTVSSWRDHISFSALDKLTRPTEDMAPSTTFGLRWNAKHQAMRTGFPKDCLEQSVYTATKCGANFAQWETGDRNELADKFCSLHTPSGCSHAQCFHTASPEMPYVAEKWTVVAPWSAEHCATL